MGLYTTLSRNDKHQARLKAYIRSRVSPHITGEPPEIIESSNGIILQPLSHTKQIKKHRNGTNQSLDNKPSSYFTSNKHGGAVEAIILVVLFILSSFLISLLVKYLSCSQSMCLRSAKVAPDKMNATKPIIRPTSNKVKLPPLCLDVRERDCPGL